MHKPITLESLGFSLPHKICFENFSAQIHYGNRIAVMGRNGSGKSSLLQILAQIAQPSSGNIKIPEHTAIGYVPQTPVQEAGLSGGENLISKIESVIATCPDILLLDEPTNHLDAQNRETLMYMLDSFPGTLILASHDKELLKKLDCYLWHIESEQIHIFSGHYDDYIREVKNKRTAIKSKISELERRKKNTHIALMKEQKRAAGSKRRGQKSIDQRKWPTIVSKAKALRAEQTSGRNKAAIEAQKNELSSQLSSLRLPEVITPKFSIQADDITNRCLVEIRQGSIAYENSAPILSDINLTVLSGDRVAIIGNNGSGKSSLAKAILGFECIKKTGDWHLPKLEKIGYLDQHYDNLPKEKTVLDLIEGLMPNCNHAEVRAHLNDFLFRTNAEVGTSVDSLSGGEKARLCLAMIAAKTPKLLVLDEITNNLDLETKQHVSQVLKTFPGALIVISHDENFLSEIGVEQRYII